MSEFVFIGQDGTKYVFNAESVDVTARGKKVFINDTSVAEYLNVGDAREAVATLKDEIDDCEGEYLVPVKHFQAEPFVEYAWARESIDDFLVAVKKLPHDFIDEFFRVYKRAGLEEACKTAKEVTEYACLYNDELTDQFTSTKGAD